MRHMLMFAGVFALSISTLSNAQKTVPEAASMLVQPTWLAAHLGDRNLVVLHVGADRRSYDAGHIPGARFLALSDIATPRNGIPNQLPSVRDLKTTFEHLGVGDRSRVVLYGDMFGVLAARAYFTLDYIGHGSSAALLDGGLENWSNEQSMERTVPADPVVATLTVHPHPELVTDLVGVKRTVSTRNIALIDARFPADYSGTDGGHAVSRAGHIPGAKNVFWAEMLLSRDNPVLKSVSEIRARYAAAGVKSGAKVVVYCQSGIQATHDYFTLKLAGFRPVLYEGSFADWSSAFATPIEQGAGG